MIAELTEAVAAVRADADRDADEQREAAATLLHQARQRADHSVGAVNAALAAIRQRLSVDGFGGHQVGTASHEPEQRRVPAPDDDDTQQMPTTGTR